MSDRKERMALINQFERRLKMNNISVPPLNKYKEQWAADDLLESYDTLSLQNAMEYYFQINPSPTWRGYANNVDKLLKALNDRNEDDKIRAERRVKARQWLND